MQIYYTNPVMQTQSHTYTNDDQLCTASEFYADSCSLYSDGQI